MTNFDKASMRSDDKFIKPPCLLFCANTWMNDKRIKQCNYMEKGLLLELLCQMYQSEKYGYLMAGSEFATYDEILSVNSGFNDQSTDHVKLAFDRILKLKLIAVDENGHYCSSKMVTESRFGE